ncbi:MAG: response regulator transcription factor, partial [Pedobacter sp.]
MSKEVKILIVEDDENLRFLVAHRLKTEGYNVLEANDGEAGERMIVADQPDIVLLDWMMPGKQGAEVCESVRKQGFENLIIMMTAKAQDVDKIDAYNFGASDYITKPFNMDVLVAMLESKVKFIVNKDTAEI